MCDYLKLINKPINELKKQYIDAKGEERETISEIIKAIKDKAPLGILKKLESSNNLIYSSEYYHAQKEKPPKKIIAELEGGIDDKKAVEVIISLYILTSIKAPGKIKWPYFQKPKPESKPKLITQIEFSKLLGISAPTVNKLCKKRFASALVGKEIDLSHPVIQEYIEEKEATRAAVDAVISKHDIKKPTPKAKKAPPQTQISPPSRNRIPTFEELENLTVQEVVERHGTMAGFKLYVDSLRGMADWKNKELKYLINRGDLIKINPLAETLFALIDLSWKRIVTEFPGAIAPQLKAIVKSSEETANIEMTALMEKELSQILKGVKTKITRSLKEARKKIS
jgi:hypothetical protein